MWASLIGCSNQLALAQARLRLAAIGCLRARRGGAFASVREEGAGLGGDDDAGDSRQRRSGHLSLRKLAGLSTVGRVMKTSARVVSTCLTSVSLSY